MGANITMRIRSLVHPQGGNNCYCSLQNTSSQMLRWLQTYNEMSMLKIGPTTDFVTVKGCQFLANLAPLETPKLSQRRVVFKLVV